MTEPNELERVRMRCVCEENGCWLWQGAMNGKGLPTICRVIDGKRTTMSTRRWVYMLTGNKLWPRNVISASCGELTCVSPEHLRRTSRSDVQRRANASDPGVIVRRAAAIKAAWMRTGRGQKLTQEQADYARDRSLPSKQVAQELGVSVSLVNLIRNGKAWKDYSNPFTGLFAMNDSGRKVA